MGTGAVTFLDRGEEITGYRVKVMRKPAFRVTGYTVVIPPNDWTRMIPEFVGQIMTDGRLDSLKRASTVPTWILGLGSWDDQCQPDGMRYTMCIEETEYTDLRLLGKSYLLHTQRFESCEWMCFEVPEERFDSDQFWKDDPYRMLRALDYRFHLRVGVHFDAAPPDHDEKKWGMEFWISVAKETEGCNVCSAREKCGEMQPFR